MRSGNSGDRGLYQLLESLAAWIDGWRSDSERLEVVRGLEDERIYETLVEITSDNGALVGKAPENVN